MTPLRLSFALLILLTACSGDPGGEPAGTADGMVLPDTSGPQPTGNEPPDMHKIGDKEAVIGETLELQLEATAKCVVEVGVDRRLKGRGDFEALLDQ